MAVIPYPKKIQKIYESRDTLTHPLSSADISIFHRKSGNVYIDLTRKTAFFEGWSWFKFNNLGLTPGTNLKFYTSLSKGLKLKVRHFWGLIPTFVEVIGEKLVGDGAFLPPPPPHPQ